MDKLISVIVPIYNVENYLKECIDSIIYQSYKNLEIILVDDGSTDNSGIICDDYAKIDSRIKVIHKKNGGISDTRNVGIDNSKGEYILFIDSDDYIDKDMCKILINKALKTDSDIVICNFYRVIDEIKIKNTLSDIEENRCFNSYEFLKIFFERRKDYGGLSVPWNKLYKASLFKNIRYNVGYIFEDIDIIYKLYYKAKRIIVIDIPLYYYRYRLQSITASFSEKHIIGRYMFMKNLHCFIENKKIEEKFMPYIEKFNLELYLECINKSLKYGIFNNNIFYKWRTIIINNEKYILNSNQIKIKNKIKYLLIKYDLYIKIYKLFHFLGER